MTINPNVCLLITFSYDYSVTALHISAFFNYKEISEVLIARGCDLNVQDVNGDTAIHVACVKGNERIVELLVRHGADTNLENKAGYNLVCFF